MEGIGDIVAGMQNIDSKKISVVRYEEDRLNQSLLGDYNETNPTIEYRKDKFRPPPQFMLPNCPDVAEHADEVDPPFYMNQISVSYLAEDIWSGMEKITEVASNEVDLNLPAVFDGLREDHPLSTITRPIVGQWTKMLLISRAGDEDFEHGVPVKGVKTSRKQIPNFRFQRKIPKSGQVQADGISTLIQPILPACESDQSEDFQHLELPEASVENQEWNEKLSLDWENEGSSIFTKLEETCELALQYIRVNEKIKGTLLNKLRSMDPFPDFIHDEVDIVEHYLRQDINIRQELYQLRSSLKERSSEDPEYRYNRIQFLDSVFAEYDKQNQPSREPLQTTPNTDDASPGSNPLQRTKSELLTPPESEGEQSFEEAPPEARSAPELTSKSAFWRILDKQQSPEVQIINGHDKDILLDMIPPGLQNIGSTTCYINAGLQLLSSVPEIFRCVEKGVKFWEESGNKDLGASKAFIGFMEERKWVMRMPPKVRSLEGSFVPDTVTDVMFQRYPKRFKRDVQQDCMEFVTSLLEAIHGEFGEERSPVSKLFMGVQWRFMRKDPPSTESEEGNVTDSTKSPGHEREEFSSVPLHFTPQHVNIEDCFSFYTSEQYSSEDKSLRWCLFEKLPRLLLVHVLSFNETEHGPKKALMKVVLRNILQFRKEWMCQAPARKAAEAEATEEEAAEADMLVEPADKSLVDGLMSSKNISLTDQGPFIEFEKSDQESVVDGVSDCHALFHLRAVVLHSGLKTTSGHYTAAVSVPGRSGERVWYHCDDDIIQRMTSLEALGEFGHNADVTCLLYEREECSTF